MQPVVAPDLHPVISRAYKTPATLEFHLPDPNGLYNPKNAASAYNLNGSSAYDPIIKSARRVLLRAGARCYTNLVSGITPTSTLAPSSGSLASLTNGSVGDVSVGSTHYVQFAPASASAFDIVVDLGAAKQVKHLVIRFGTKRGTCTLPALVTFGWSTDNVTYTDLPTRPVAGNGSNPGDWEDSYYGRNVEVVRCDVGQLCRYIRFRVTPTGAQTLYLDELAVYGGSAFSTLGYNVFVGRLGSAGEIPNTGVIACTAIDELVKLMRNRFARVTAVFGNPPVELADILYSLATQQANWSGSGSAFDAPLSGSDLGWTSGSNATGAKIPIWQGKANSMFGYWLELLNFIGAEPAADGNGVLQIRQLPYRQTMPDRVFIADPDGNVDAKACLRNLDDADVRNVVNVFNAAPDTPGSASTTTIHSGSIAFYEAQFPFDIYDPLAKDVGMREKIGQRVVRDYAFRDQSLTCTLRPDPDFGVRKVYAVRASREPYLYAKSATGRLQELWFTETVAEHITVGDWWADCQMVPYVPAGPAAPTGVTATPEAAPNTTFVDVSWTASTDTDVTLYKIYYTDDINHFPTTTSETDASTGPHAIGGLTPGTKYYFYVTAVGANGQEGLPSAIAWAIPGGAAGDSSGWAVTDLAVSWTQTNSPADSNDTYKYTFRLQWSSPPVPAPSPDNGEYGFKQGEWRFLVKDAGDPAPTSTNIDDWQRYDEWHGHRVPPGKGGSVLPWDGNANGYLLRDMTVASATSLSGKKLYVRMWTWPATNGRRDPSHASNVAVVTIP